MFSIPCGITLGEVSRRRYHKVQWRIPVSGGSRFLTYEYNTEEGNVDAMNPQTLSGPVYELNITDFSLIVYNFTNSTGSTGIENTNTEFYTCFVDNKLGNNVTNVSITYSYGESACYFS